MIDLQQPRPQLTVQNNIHAQNLETHVVFVVARLAGTVVVGKLGLGGGQGFQE